ncbi:MAG: tRNA (N6-isopentenyl adenosine(37)-C2)-methylthiotransferase MiaB [Bacteroidetes bacterium]|nr:tRNA (N6-isopentenyl adenosine(37)-C2)-methylthiotransferase MiaB [Bacteroidota bacterium]MBU1423382.1 tRNA (N6-isopentenyl adenosine(37)-C2)-methylthiotransferase MiaB [Bacteroidota bacterium]
MQDKKLYIETYGCQMNVADSEIVMTLMTKDGYSLTEQIDEADVILVNTCSVRENAEDRVTARLNKFKKRKKEKPEVVVGVLGCMAERLKTKFFDGNTTRKSKVRIADLVVGPDEYRKLPELVYKAWHGEKGIAVQLSRVENYDDITPLRTNGLSAWITVMRGCDKFCTFCLVPFTRGRERSRPLQSILNEIENLSKQGFKEVTLLGQNVNSYSDNNYDFTDLLKKSAEVNRGMRIRFTTSHPADMSDKLIHTIAAEPNICNYIHLPVQSGSDRILTLMNRNYTSSQYLYLIENIKKIIPGVSISTDIITGFPTETEEDHRMTIELMKQVRFDGAFMFAYSPREKTKAWSMTDDVSQAEKVRRLSEIIEIQNKISYENNLTQIGKHVEVLIEGTSKRSDQQLKGRTDTNKKVIFPRNGQNVGDFVTVKIESVNSATLFGTIKD